MNDLETIRHRTIQVYDKHAQAWDAHRPGVFFERPWLDRFIAKLPAGGRVLDVGCGAGKPIAGYLIERGFRLTGLDASSNMLEISKSRFPQATWLNADMRDLDLDTRFDGIVSWDGFFHLTQAEQREVLSRFADHLGSDGALLLTIGPEAGEVTGTVEGEPVYHASLDPDEYRSILKSRGFNDIEIELEDERCGFHSVLLAKRA